MSPRKEEKTNGICLWCGKLTVGDTTREHIFPKAIGGKKTLAVGSVCRNCNQKFGEMKYGLDNFLKKEHPAMMRAIQVDPRLGRIRDKNDRERKKKEKNEINGVGESAHTKISRKNSDEYWLNANLMVQSEIFVRALHKCTANVLCDNYGSLFTRKNYNDLLKFVKDGGDTRPWSYAVSFSKPFNTPITDEPKPLIFRANVENRDLVGFIHTSGIWLTGSQPYLLNPEIIETTSEMIVEKDAHSKEPKTRKSITDFFGFNYESNARTAIAKLKFLWITKEIEGTPNDQFLYILTKCKLCGQTNPTGITLPKDIIYNGNLNKTIHYDKNTWNRYTLEDLTKSGLKVDKWDKNSLEKYMAQGISIPIENDVKKMEIHKCKTICINCGYLINYSASDCFI